MLKTLLHFVLGCLLGLMLLAYVFANRFIFHPPQSNYRDTNEIIKLKTANGAVISAIYLQNPQAKYTLLVSHGNAEDLGSIYPWLEQLKAHGFSVFAYDYQGYGTSTGKPTETHVYQDINAAYEYMTHDLKIPPQKIILYGRSLGAGAAIDLAARHKVAGVIAEGAFVSIFRVITIMPLLPFDKFNNLVKIKDIHAPILFIHGMRDYTVAVWHGKKLFVAANEPKQALWVEGAGHNNVVAVAGEKYWQAITQFVSGLS